MKKGSFAILSLLLLLFAGCLAKQPDVRTIAEPIPQGQL